MAMVQRPNAVGLILCRLVIVEEKTRNVTLANSFQRLEVEHRLVRVKLANDVAERRGQRGGIARSANGDRHRRTRLLAERQIDTAEPALHGPDYHRLLQVRYHADNLENRLFLAAKPDPRADGILAEPILCGREFIDYRHRLFGLLQGH